MVESPCTGQCGIVDGICTGCLRKESEIFGWADLTEQEQQDVLEAIEDREYPTQ
jgi:predicted Fe-S protein YdhL (DUF1289 family)